MVAVKTLLTAVAVLVGEVSDHSLTPRRPDANSLIVATSVQLAPLMQRTAQELQRDRPGVRVSIVAVGSDVAMAELYTHRADVAVIGRVATDPEIKAYQWIYQNPPRRWTVLRGSFATPGHSPSIRLLVHASNPLREISRDQLEMAFRGKHPLRWRDLGVSGALGGRWVHPIIPDTEQGTGRFIRDVLFKGSTLFAWDQVREITEPLHRTSIDDRVGNRIAAAVASDPQALAFLPGNPVPGTRAVPLRCEQAEKQAQCDKSGALERSIYAYSDPDLRPDARAFLRLLAGVGADLRIDVTPYRQLPADEARELQSDLK